MLHNFTCQDIMTQILEMKKESEADVAVIWKW